MERNERIDPICTLAGLREKEVINICNGKRLGYITDAEIDLCSGCLLAIRVPGECESFFSRAPDIRIPWQKIERIGKDTVLVMLNELPKAAK